MHARGLGLLLLQRLLLPLVRELAVRPRHLGPVRERRHRAGGGGGDGADADTVRARDAVPGGDPGETRGGGERVRRRMHAKGTVSGLEGQCKNDPDVQGF